MNKEPVFLNVYDILSVMSGVISNVGLGLYHSGVQVYGKEYTFFGHESADTGVFEMIPRNEEILGSHFKFREFIYIGYTTLREEDIKDTINTLSLRFSGNSYHITNRNCNHFSNEFTKIICGKDIPLWVNRLADVGSWLLCGVQPIAFALPCIKSVMNPSERKRLNM